MIWWKHYMGHVNINFDHKWNRVIIFTNQSQLNAMYYLFQISIASTSTTFHLQLSALQPTSSIYIIFCFLISY